MAQEDNLEPKGCGFVNLRGTGNLQLWGGQEEWDKKELASFKEEIADKRKQMEVCLSHLKTQTLNCKPLTLNYKP